MKTDYIYRVECLDADYHGKPAVVLTGSEEAVRALGSHFLLQVRVVPVGEPVSEAYKLPEPEPPKTPLTEEQQDYGTRMLAVWHRILPGPDMAPMRRGEGLFYVPPCSDGLALAEVSLDQVKGWNGSWTYLWSLSVVHNGKHSGPMAVEGRDADELVGCVRKVLTRYARDYCKGSKKGPSRHEMRAGKWEEVQDYRDADLPAVPWCRWVLERMPEVKS